MDPDFRCGIMRTDETTLDYSIRLAQQIDNGMELNQKICFIGDSNMRDCFKSCSHYEILKPYAHLFELHVKGGAKISHLREIFHKVAHFRFIIVGLGGNDLNSTAEDDMLKNLKNFLSHLPAKRPQQVVFFLQLFPRGDHLKKDNGAKLVKFNDMLRSNFPNEYHSTSSWVSRCHFRRDSAICHFDKKYLGLFAKVLCKCCDHIIRKACVIDYSSNPDDPFFNF